MRLGLGLERSEQVEQLSLAKPTNCPREDCSSRMGVEVLGPVLPSVKMVGHVD